MIEEVRKLIRTKEASCVELTQRSLELIAVGDIRLNPVVALRAEQALAEAADQDRRLSAREAAGPLAGVPLLVKDLEDLAGVVTTQGSLVYADSAPAAADGIVPGRLRAAGAIAISKTNLPECAFEAYTANRLYGTTRNPWDTELSPGARAAARRRRCPPAWCRWRRRPTAVDPPASRLPSAGWSGSSRSTA